MTKPPLRTKSTGRSNDSRSWPTAHCRILCPTGESACSMPWPPSAKGQWTRRQWLARAYGDTSSSTLTSAPDGTFGIDHYAADCVKCLCCQTICRSQAIVVEDTVPANVLVNAVPERHVMHPVRVPKGGVHSIMNSMRDLLGLPEVFER